MTTKSDNPVMLEWKFPGKSRRAAVVTVLAAQDVMQRYPDITRVWNIDPELMLEAQAILSLPKMKG
jgi:hypothetical protein